MKTSKILAVLLAALVSLSSCNIDCITGSGKESTEIRNEGTFSAIETSGSMKLVLKQDSVQQIKVVADDNIQEHIRTRLSGDKLIINMDGNFCDQGPVTVFLTAKNFSGLKASGSVEVVGVGRINTSDFSLDLSGSTEITLDLNAANVATKSSGSSSIALKGQASTHEVKISGSADLDAGDFIVGEYAIKSTGSSNCLINVLNKLDVRSSGSSDVKYRGNPASVNNHDSGSSSVTKVD